MFVAYPTDANPLSTPKSPNTGLPFSSTARVVGPGGLTIANNWAGMWGPSVSLVRSFDDAGVFLSPQTYYWTGMNTTGSALNTCAGWSTIADGQFGTIGDSSATDFNYVDNANDVCLTTYNVVCVCLPVTSSPTKSPSRAPSTSKPSRAPTSVKPSAKPTDAPTHSTLPPSAAPQPSSGVSFAVIMVATVVPLAAAVCLAMCFTPRMWRRASVQLRRAALTTTDTAPPAPPAPAARAFAPLVPVPVPAQVGASTVRARPIPIPIPISETDAEEAAAAAAIADVHRRADELPESYLRRKNMAGARARADVQKRYGVAERESEA